MKESHALGYPIVIISKLLIYLRIHYFDKKSTCILIDLARKLQLQNDSIHISDKSRTTRAEQKGQICGDAVFSNGQVIF